MNKNLTTTNQNAKLVLSKSKSLLNVINSLLSNQESSHYVDDSWIEELFKWADEKNIPDPDAEKGRWFDDKGEKWNKGIPRDKERLLSMKDLNLTGAYFNPNEITELPDEITYLININELSVHNQNLSKLPNNISRFNKLEKLCLSKNPLERLPEDICNLKRLKILFLDDCKSLILSEKQKEWISNLEKNGCTVYSDDDLFSRGIPKIEINHDEIPF